jgi:lipoprotein-anchoring transpeptidase ErfK/SrfK
LARSFLVAVMVVLAVQCAIPDKWIEVNLATGRLYAREGQDMVLDAGVLALGTASYPVRAGEYRVESRQRLIRGVMGSDAFIVAWVLDLGDGGRIQGSYCKKRMGCPMIHNAIRLRNDDAALLWKWTPVGTPVIVHDGKK